MVAPPTVNRRTRLPYAKAFFDIAQDPLPILGVRSRRAASGMGHFRPRQLTLLRGPLPLRPISDRCSRSCLPVDVRFGPRATYIRRCSETT
jgi:hypothetical protein